MSDCDVGWIVADSCRILPRDNFKSETCSIGRELLIQRDESYDDQRAKEVRIIENFEERGEGNPIR
jgi:hypothetical protein